MIIRPEKLEDIAAISTLTTAAFLDNAHSNGTEAQIIAGLRDAGALTVSLVAEQDNVVVGHVAFSPVAISNQASWYGLGPVSVRADQRGRGIAKELIEMGLGALEVHGAGGCVVLGNPAYYGRFGFTCGPALTLAGVPPEFFMQLRFQGEPPIGAVTYHPAFGL